MESPVNGQSYDCPSIAARVLMSLGYRFGTNGQSYDCPSIAAVIVVVAYPHREWNGQSYDCPSIAATASPAGVSIVPERNGQSYDCPSIAASSKPPLHRIPGRTGSLTTAPPLRHPQLDCRRPLRSRERAVLRLPLHCGRTLRVRCNSGSPERAVLRLPLHCGIEVETILKELGAGNGQSYDCPSIAAYVVLGLAGEVTLRTGSLTTAPPLRPFLFGRRTTPI